MAFIQQFVAFAIEQDAPIPWHALVGWVLGADARSTVGGDGVIPARLVPQSVKGMDVFKKTFARLRWRNRCAVKIDILLAVVCAHADHVALIGHDVDEFELPVKPADGRVGLAKLLARLDGEAERRRVSELEAGNGMRDPGRAPVIDRQVDACDLRDAHRARLPMRGVFGLGPVVAVAYVVQRYFVALNVSPRFLGHVRLPVAIVGRRKRQPPDEHAGKQHDEDAQLSPERPNEYQDDHGSQRQESRHNLVCISERSIKPHGAKCPGYSDDGYQKNDHRADPANHSHQIAPSTTSDFKIHFRPIVGRLYQTPAWDKSIGVSQKRPTDRFLKPLLSQSEASPPTATLAR